MTKIFKTLVVLAMVFGLVAGVYLMQHGRVADHDDCVAALLGNGNCGGANPLQASFLHLRVLSDIFTTVLSLGNWILLWGLLLAILYLKEAVPSPQNGSFKFSSENNDQEPKASRFLAWLSIHEKRDPYVAF